MATRSSEMSDIFVLRYMDSRLASEDHYATYDAARKAGDELAARRGVQVAVSNVPPDLIHEALRRRSAA